MPARSTSHRPASDQPAVPITVASERLRISVDAIRKRIARGTLSGHKTKDGGWMVVVPQADDRPASDQPASTLVTALEDRIVSLEHQLASRTEEAKHAADSASQKDAIIANQALTIGRLVEQIRALPTTIDVQSMPQERDSASPRGDRTAEAPSAYASEPRSLALVWRRWWRGIRGG